MNTIAISKLKKHLKQHIQEEQFRLDMEILEDEYLSVKNTQNCFNLDDYVDYIVDSIIESSDKLDTSSGSSTHSDYDTMLYHITDTVDSKRVSYEFDQFNWIGRHDTLHDIVLPVLDKLKFI